MTPLNRTDDCELCGEPNVALFKSDYVPEEFEGVACQTCCHNYEQEFKVRLTDEHDRLIGEVHNSIVALHTFEALNDLPHAKLEVVTGPEQGFFGEWYGGD